MDTPSRHHVIVQQAKAFLKTRSADPVPLADLGATVLVACVLAIGSTASAQGFEITPFGGYRFGGDVFELIAQRPLDLDGAPVVGVAIDMPIVSGVQFEALFTHQHTHVVAPESRYGPPVRWRMSVDHWQAGGLSELDTGRVRPFLTGALGLTRYGTSGDNEIRFALGAGGGVKVFPSERIGVRLGSHLFATFVDAGDGAFACAPRACLIRFDPYVIWQIEFTAGLIVRFH